MMGDMMELQSKIGMLQSRLIYDYKPFIKSKMKKFYSQFIQEGDLCFDIGAHTGNRSDVWLSLGARVVAVEPQDRFAKLILRKLGYIENFRLLQLAVGDRPGNANLRISYRHPAISTISENWLQVMKDFDPSVLYEDSVEVSVTTLDLIIEEFGVPKFCKIDVEGFEERVLLGLSAAIPALSFEFFPTTLQRAVICIERLEELAEYQYNWSLVESFKMINKKFVDASEMKKQILQYKGRKSGDIYSVLKKGA
jgi:FkbM family methyltransferase